MALSEIDTRAHDWLVRLLTSLRPLPMTELLGVDEDTLERFVAQQLVEQAGFNEDCMPLYQLTPAGYERFQ